MSYKLMVKTQPHIVGFGVLATYVNKQQALDDQYTWSRIHPEWKFKLVDMDDYSFYSGKYKSMSYYDDTPKLRSEQHYDE